MAQKTIKLNPEYLSLNSRKTNKPAKTKKSGSQLKRFNQTAVGAQEYSFMGT